MASSKEVSRWPWVPLLAAFLAMVAAGLLISDVRRMGEETRREDLGFLLADSRKKAGELEAVLYRIDGELARMARLAGEGGRLRVEGLDQEFRARLADLDTLLAAFALLDPAGEVLWADPSPLVEAALDSGLAEGVQAAALQPETLVLGSILLADGRSIAGALRAVRAGEGDPLGFILLLLDLEQSPGTWPEPSHALLYPTYMLLDDLGHVLSHPEGDWVGWLLLADVDSLYDPELWDILPEILSPEGGAWLLASEVAAPGSWARGLESAISSSPVRLPNGDRWHLVLTVTEGSGPILGFPASFEVGGLAVLLAILLLGSSLILLLRGMPTSWATSDGAEGAWYRSLVEAGADGLVVVSGQDRVVTANEAFARLSGMPLESLVGSRFQDLLEPPVPEVDETVVGELRSGWTEARLRSEDDSPLEVEMNTAEFNVDSEVYRLAMVRDVTWRRGIERETLRVGEKERLLLGKELHDGVGQTLTGVAFMAKSLAGKLVNEGRGGADEAHRIAELVKDAVGQIRILSKGLELAEYEAQELPRALQEMSEVVRRLMGVNLDVNLALGLETAEAKLDGFLATQLYRLCHDVVSDAVRDLLAQNISVSITREGGLISLVVHHDGRKPEGDATRGITMPFYRFRYRARLLDAALKVSDAVGGGTTISCSFRVQGNRG